MARTNDDDDRRRRIAKDVDPGDLNQWLQRANYVGSPHHKRKLAGFPYAGPAPRSRKDTCEFSDGRNVNPQQARALLKKGFRQGLVSDVIEEGFPYLVWCVEGNNVFEAKVFFGSAGEYHGYRLNEKNDWRKKVLRAFKRMQSERRESR